MKRLGGVLLCLFVITSAAWAAGAASPAPGQEGKTHTLVLLRHGESIWNKEGRFTGWSDIPLTEKGEAGAFKAGEIMRREGLAFDAAYTSYLNRAIKTAWLALEGMNLMWIPVHADWRFNERCYGDLEGKTRKEVTEAKGEDQVKIWRRSFDVPPPPLAYDDPRSPAADPRYKALAREQIPRAESLKDTIARSRPVWDNVLAPALKSGKTILVVGHSTSLRALSKCIDPALDEQALQKLEIPNSTPIVYTLDAALKPVTRKVLVIPKTETK